MAQHIEDILESEGVFASTSAGVSMWPLLRNRRDTVVISRVEPGQRLRRYDVPLYRRGDAYVLHRIVDVGEDHYVICGDNCSALEHVPFDCVIGVLSQAYRGERQVNLEGAPYQAYSRAWVALYPFRRGARVVRGALARALLRGVWRSIRRKDAR